MSNVPSSDEPPRLTRAMFLKLTAFFALLTLVSAADLVLRGLRRYPLPVQAPVWSVPGGEAARGHVAIERHGCGACHTIPGVRTATGHVGPGLEGLRNRVYLAGVVPNTPDNLTAWIMHPRAIDPRTAMPDLDVPEGEAREIAAYLYAER